MKKYYSGKVFLAVCDWAGTLAVKTFDTVEEAKAFVAGFKEHELANGEEDANGSEICEYLLCADLRKGYYFSEDDGEFNPVDKEIKNQWEVGNFKSVVFKPYDEDNLPIGYYFFDNEVEVLKAVKNNAAFRKKGLY